jgi:beta-N-acetylhexosaminidase
MFLKHKAVIFGVSGLEILPLEREFFANVKPVGFILFARNISDKKQVAALVEELRNAVGNQHAPIFIDQEGGRVCRLKEPEWYSPPAARFFGEMAEKNLSDAKHALSLNTSLIACDLMELGITSDAIPVLDVLSDDTHTVIGDRAYSSDKSIVTKLGQVVCKTLAKFGIAPIIKHIPGHGKANSDSHLELPIVDETYENLREIDFYPFSKLNNENLAMTAHVLYKAIDPNSPATLSKKVISEIRNVIGFKNLLLTDCILMNALSGSLRERAERALSAGCDIILQSSGTIEEMQEVAGSMPLITEAQNKILEKAFKAKKRKPKLDKTKTKQELNDLFEKYKIKISSKKSLIDPTA